MVSVKNIIEEVEKFAPLSLQYSWDNSGFLCGDINKEVKKLYITLDVNVYTVREAVKSGADMILSHHPIMFRGMKKIDYSAPDGYVIKELIKNDIALYASHTPMDCACGGINDVLADKLGIINKKILEKNNDFEGCGLGRIGELKEEKTVSEFADIVKKQLGAHRVRVCGDTEKKIKTVAVGGGACDDLIPLAKAMGANAMVTSDMKYHISMDGIESGICIIDAGHYYTEFFVTDIFEKLFEDYDIEIIKTTQEDVFEFI